jgi:hypothetical protein
MGVQRNKLMYGAGAQFSLAFFVMLDASVFSHSALNGSDPPVHINFIDWLPLIFSSLGMLIINSIEKTRLSADSFSYSGSGVAWKARVVLFLGFASLAGGMAGGVTVLVLKYVVPGTVWPTLYMGVASVLSNGLVMLRYVVSVCGGLRSWLMMGLQLGGTLDQPEYGG